MTGYGPAAGAVDAYFTCAPGVTGAEGEITTREPSGFWAERIMPCDSTPLSFLHDQ